MTKNILLVLSAFTLLWFGQVNAYVGTFSKLDDLYRVAIKSSEFKGMSQQAFKTSLQTGKLTKIAPLLKSFPKEDRLRILLEVADERKLISGTQQLRLAPRYSKIDKGEELLMGVIEHGDKKLFDLAPRYGNKLLAIESKHKGAGVRVVTSLGDEGWKVMNQIPDNQIASFANQAEHIALLKPETRTQFLDAISAYPIRALEYLNKNSSIVYKSTGVAGFLIFIDNFSQPTTTKLTKPDGTVIETQSGAVAELSSGLIYILWLVGILLSTALAIWLGIHLWGSLKKKQAKLENLNTPPET